MSAFTQGLHWFAVAGLLSITSCTPAEDAGEDPSGQLSASALGVQEGAPLRAHDASCLRLEDANTWDSYTAHMASVPNARKLSDILQDLNRSGPVLTSTTHPPATGYKGGFRWADDDMATQQWIPQALTAGISGDRNVAIASWHYAGTEKCKNGDDNKCVRVSVADITDMSAAAVHYRHLLLVKPTADGQFTIVPEHGGGLSWVGHYLFMADTGQGIRVFDLDQIRQVDTVSCDDKIGQQSTPSGPVWCAYGYKYVLPQVSAYNVPADIQSPCRPTFSFLGQDKRGQVPVILSGEYCNATTTPCRVDAGPGLGGRLYRWPLDAMTQRLQTGGGTSVKPEKAYVMNEPNVQGVAPITTTTSTSSYWLSSTRYTGALFKVSTSASRVMYSTTDNTWAHMPEGMHATASGTNLWTVTEGYTKDGTPITDPAKGGRVVFFVNQASVD